MDKTTERALASELIDLNAQKSAYLKPKVSHADVRHYTDEARFNRELAAIFRRVPQVVAHSSQLPGEGAFMRCDIAGLPVLLTRDSSFTVHAFLNVCRHRGMRLVTDSSGCKRRFSCPYHAWTYSNQGELLAVPHEQQGFPDLDKSSLGLTRLSCHERHGWVWVSPVVGDTESLLPKVEVLGQEFDAIGMADHQIVHTDERIGRANWKIFVEGGLEAYHFRVAHRDTIGPYFLDNLSSYQRIGPNLRSILARKTLTTIDDVDKDAFRLRDHAQILYSVFPTTQLLVQDDHFAWIQIEPISVDSTRIRIHTLAPAARVRDADDLAHWARNHAITVDTLTEDFEIGEGIQEGLSSGANAALMFGRF
ncbi:MAG: SRPBCC family protein, partial [Pseudomonadota bacterium]